MKKILLILAIMMSGAVFAPEYVNASMAPRQEFSVSEPTLKTHLGALEVSCPADGRTYTFQIYSITGHLVKKFSLSETTATVEIPQGCYIIKCEAWTKKAVVN